MLKITEYGIDTLELSEEEQQNDLLSASRYLQHFSVTVLSSGRLIKFSSRFIRICADSIGSRRGIGSRQEARNRFAGNHTAPWLVSQVGEWNFQNFPNFYPRNR